MSPAELADRTRRARRAAVAAARSIGLEVATARVLHDVFSVVVHLEPLPVVARIPVVLPPGTDLDHQAERQQRELDVLAWLDGRGVPVVRPAPGLPRSPVVVDGFCMSFWELADVAEDHEPYSGVEIARSADLHAELADYPAPLPFLSPFNWAVANMLGGLADAGPLSGDEIRRARGEFELLQTVLGERAAFESAFGPVHVQAIQGDAPSHNVIRTTTGLLYSDFEDVTLGPVEWDLAMVGPDGVAEYDAAARALGRPPTDPRVQPVLDAARTLQLVGCVALIPELPVLGEGLAQVVESWRASPPFERCW